MRLQDALFNWLQIKVVADARPDDSAAHDTVRFFADILHEDHQLNRFEAEIVDEERYEISYESDGNTRTQRFDKELVEQLLNDICCNPKYNE